MSGFQITLRTTYRDKEVRVRNNELNIEIPLKILLFVT